jgi:hypothetical protein
MHKDIPGELASLVGSIRGLECWYVSSGGAACSTFALSFGAKIRRPVPIKNPAHSEEFRHFEGELNLLVWCAWRLDGPDAPLTSWDDADESISAQLTKLIGATVESVELIQPAFDLVINFSNALCLRVFCDHVPGEPSFDGNWDLTAHDEIVSVGPGAKISVENRRRSG